MRRVASALIAASLAACVPMRPAGAPEGWPKADWIVDARTGEKMAFEALIADLAASDVVFVGEDHDNPHHHEVQRRILAALLEKKPDLALGMEMLQEKHQPAADRYVAGTIDLDGFAAETEWRRSWGFPISLYQPLLELAREKKAPIVALRTSEETAQLVSRVGLDRLSPEEKAKLPELDLGNAEHQSFVRKAFERHHAMPEDRFQRFYAVQVLWDETMAERTVQAWKNGGNETRPVMVVAGTGHLIRRLGIPSRVERRVPEAKTRVVLTLPRQALASAVEKKEGDWLWVTPLAPRKKKKK